LRVSDLDRSITIIKKRHLIFVAHFIPTICFLR
jgi:hypothetical protein